MDDGPKSILGAIDDRIKSNFNLNDLLAMFTIPVERHLIKKNNRPAFSINGRGVLGKTSELKKAEKNMCLHLRSQANKQKIYQPFSGPLWVITHFYYKLEDYITKAGVMKKTIGDLDNLLCLPLDCLEDSGIIENDSQVCSLDLTRRLVGNETKVDIFILRHIDQWTPQLKLSTSMDGK